MSFPRLVVLVLAAATGTGCGKSVPPSAGPASGPVQVRVARATTQPLNWVIEQPGAIAPHEITPLVAKIPGYVKTVAPDGAAARAGAKLADGLSPVIDIGSEVTAGQLLATLAVPELDKEFAEKVAAVEQATAARGLMGRRRR